MKLYVIVPLPSESALFAIITVIYYQHKSITYITSFTYPPHGVFHLLGPQVIDEATVASHKLVLWTPAEDNPERRKDRGGGGVAECSELVPMGSQRVSCTAPVAHPMAHPGRDFRVGQRGAT